MEKEIQVERHPWEAFLPDGVRCLLLGTFPPQRHRWSMKFYYPNKTNDFWRVMGLLFYQDRDALWDADGQCFDLPHIKALLTERGIGLWDTGMAVRRLRDNASDKFLEIVEPIDLGALLDAHPTITRVATTGEKATGVIAQQAGVEVPAMGSSVQCTVAGHEFTLWRMPSTSRAYPLALERKAAYYRQFLEPCLDK